MPPPEINPRMEGVQLHIIRAEIGNVNRYFSPYNNSKVLNFQNFPGGLSFFHNQKQSRQY